MLRRLDLCNALILALFASFSLPAPSLAEVKCSCPTVSAEGEGNSSCSANESGGRCTIDYNLFGERENLAASYLAERVDGNFIPRPNMNSTDALQIARAENQVFEQIFVYLFVAAASQAERFSETVPSENAELFLRLLSDFRDPITFAFSEDARNFSRIGIGAADQVPEAFVDVGEVVVSPGCVEVNAGDQWVMFKVFWAMSAPFPGCRIDG